MQSVLTFRDMFFEKYFQPLASKNLSLLTSVAFATFRDVFPEEYFRPPALHPAATQALAESPLFSMV
jgi:hypothetical protein